MHENEDENEDEDEKNENMVVGMHGVCATLAAAVTGKGITKWPIGKRNPCVRCST